MGVGLEQSLIFTCLWEFRDAEPKTRWQIVLDSIREVSWRNIPLQSLTYFLRGSNAELSKKISRKTPKI
jgi:hypothetical protein